MSHFAAAVFLLVLAGTLGLAAVTFALIVRPVRRQT